MSCDGILDLVDYSRAFESVRLIIHLVRVESITQNNQKGIYAGWSFCLLFESAMKAILRIRQCNMLSP